LSLTLERHRLHEPLIKQNIVPGKTGFHNRGNARIKRAYGFVKLKHRNLGLLQKQTVVLQEGDFRAFDITF
jgi:hypothetical protein